ncbi:MAG: hypothetical protein A4E19_02155 [Nitrospira sp. SG-bin1]|nr:MAG: hypothetical protein A4E19_02155 [Nitrospira sp. SG-bin1]
MVKIMLQGCPARWSIGLSLAIALSVGWSLSHAGTTKEQPAALGPATSDTMSIPHATEAIAGPMLPAAVPVEQGLVLRTMPTVSKPISVGGTTLVPYIGAGFGGGYATDLDRSLNAGQSVVSGSFNGGLKNLFGPQLIPNEVQLGVRFPF